MAQFRAIIKGNRNSVSRLGGKKSGIDAFVNGWYLGVRIRGHVDETGNDVFEVYRTGGSNHGEPERHILTLKP